MMHKFLKDEDGSPMIVGDAPGYPYCSYVVCIYCRQWFCDNGCDSESLSRGCDEAFETLFEWEHLIDRSRYEYE